MDRSTIELVRASNQLSPEAIAEVGGNAVLNMWKVTAVTLLVGLVLAGTAVALDWPRLALGLAIGGAVVAVLHAIGAVVYQLAVINGLLMNIWRCALGLKLLANEFAEDEASRQGSRIARSLE